MKKADLVVIHGVGPFDEGLVIASVRGVLRTAGVSLDRVKVVNWRRMAGDLSGEESAVLEQVASVSRGVQGTVHVETDHTPRYVRSFRTAALVAPLICAALLLTPLPFFSFLALAIGGTITLAHIACEIWSEQRGVATAVCSGLLPWVWSVAHAVVMIPYLFLRIVASRIGWWAHVVAFLLIPLSFFLFQIGFLSIFLPPLVLYAVTYVTKLGFFDALVPAWHRSVEQTSAGLLLLAADVVRYIGDSRYRTAIREKTAHAIRTRRDGPVMVVAHSLGSVIAFDALAQMNPHEGKDIVLITMGSPLRRLMHRFMPAAYPQPRQARAQLVKAARLRRWINIYRPQDVVGAALFGDAGGDFSTDQRFRGPLARLRAHLNYWDDRMVLERVLSALRQPTAALQDDAVAPSPVVNGPIPSDSATFAQGVDLLSVLLPAAAFARLVWLLIWLYHVDQSPLLTILLGIVLVVLVPSTMRALFVYTLSFAGIDQGGVQFVPAIAKAQQEYEESLDTE